MGWGRWQANAAYCAAVPLATSVTHAFCVARHSQERELARQAAQLAKDAAEAEVRGREAAKQLGQVRHTGTVGGLVGGAVWA